MKKMVTLFLIVLFAFVPWTVFGASNDNNVEWEGLAHDPSATVEGTSQTYLYLDYANNQTVFWVRTYKGDVTGITVRMWYNSSEHLLSMSWDHNSADGVTYDYWKAVLPKQSQLIYYHFRVTDGTDTDYLQRDPDGTPHAWYVSNTENTDDWAFNDTSLPVELSQFSALFSNGQVVLRWQTQSEINNLGFNVLRSESVEGKFVKLNAELIPGAGNSSDSHTYSFADPNVLPERTYYYKLEDIDINGTRTAHGPISVFVAKSNPAPNEFGLLQNYPNPFNPATTIRFKLKEADMVTLSVYDAKGQLVRQLVNGKLARGAHKGTEKQPRDKKRLQACIFATC